MKNFLIASALCLFSSSAFASGISLKCEGRELVPGNQGRFGHVLVDADFDSLNVRWDSAENASICELEQLAGSCEYSPNEFGVNVFEVSSRCGEKRQGFFNGEEHLVIANSLVFGRYACLHRAAGLKAEIELRRCVTR